MKKKQKIFIIVIVLLALAIIRNWGGNTQNNHEEITPTGYPSDEIQRQQVMYNGVLYYYTANGFNNPLPDGYEFVGEVKKVDNKQKPTADWCGSRVDIGQKIYVSDNTSVIYLEYERGYAAFAAVETEPEVKIDYGASSIYTKEEMDAAIELIKKEFNTWDGCELHSISYSTTFSAKPIPDRIEEKLVKLSLQEVPLTKKGIAETMNVKPHQLDFLLGRYGMEPFWSNAKKGNDGTGSMNKYVKAYYDQAGKTCVDQYAKKKGFHATSEFVRYALDRIMELDEPKTPGTAS